MFLTFKNYLEDYALSTDQAVHVLEDDDELLQEIIILLITN